MKTRNVRVVAEMFPVASFVEEELEARQIRLGAFLHVIGITIERWRELQGGAGMLLGECERIAGALQLNPIFISNLNLMWNEWRRQHPAAASSKAPSTESGTR